MVRYTSDWSTMSEYDLHTAIKRLAEVEWPCDAIGGCTYCEDGGKCTRCDSTGRIVPFAALRVPYYSYPSTPETGTTDWVPEPDVEKACWRILKLAGLRLVPSGMGHYKATFSAGGSSGWCKTEEEAVLRAVEAWVKERHERTRGN